MWPTEQFEFETPALESVKIIIGSLKSEKIWSLHVYTGYLIFSLKKTVFLLCIEVQQTFSFPFSLLRHYQMPECFYVKNCCF